MISTFVHNNGKYWLWYVLIDSHVLDQGMARTEDRARGAAETSKVLFASELAVNWV